MDRADASGVVTADDRDRVPVICGRGHKPRRIGFFYSPGVRGQWLAEGEASHLGLLAADPSGRTYTYEMRCPCGFARRANASRGLLDALDLARDERRALRIDPH